MQLLKILSIASLTSVFALTAAANITDLGQIDRGQTISLDLPDTSGDIFAAVDGIDVSDLVLKTSTGLQITPITSFGPGIHRLVVYRLSEDGLVKIAEAKFREAAIPFNWSIDAQHDAEIRTVNGIETTTLDSAGSLTIEAEDQSTTAFFEYLASSQDALQINGNAIDIPEYLISIDRSTDRGDFRANLGHHSISYDTTLVADLTRRGFSSDFESASDRFGIGVFGMRASDILGLSNFTGLEDADDRLWGGQFWLRPFSNRDFQISLQSYKGSAVYFPGADPAKGSGVSFGVNGSSQNGRFFYDLSFADVEYDEDGDAILYEPVHGRAALGSFNYDLINDMPTTVSLGLEFGRVDQYYYSLANEGLPTGVENVRLSADVTGDAFNVGVSLETQKTNINGDVDDPTDRLNFIDIEASYFGFAGGSFWDNATLSSYVSYSDKHRLITPLLAEDPSDYKIMEFGINFDVTGDIWSWGLGFSYLDDNDLSADNLDFVQTDVTGTLGYNPSADLNVTLAARYSRLDDIFDRWNETAVDVTLDYTLIPDLLKVSSAAGIVSTTEPAAPGSSYIEGALSWRFIPNAEFVLAGRYAKDDEASESGEDEDRIISLTLRSFTNLGN